MKRRWRRNLEEWKSKCIRDGKTFSTLPKQEFPALLKNLLKKDYSNSIISGFECSGIFPLNPARPLSRLPPDEAEVESLVQQQLLNQLKEMRHNPPANVRAQRPRKTDKLPAGQSYTCPPEEGEPSVDEASSSSSSETSSSNSDSEEESEDDRSLARRRLFSKMKSNFGKKQALNRKQQENTQKKLLVQLDSDNDANQLTMKEAENVSMESEGEDGHH